MGNYATKDARYTAIYRREERVEKGGKREVFFLVPFELVRYNVDQAGEQDQVIVPVGQPVKTPQPNTQTAAGIVEIDSEKVYEKIWIVDVVPFGIGRGGKHDFGFRNDEGEQLGQPGD